ncbi:DUF2330 domain-containing protein [Planktotalea sp.]|uniref:DUF2330 domain-containing protein n=1 Tax=Planktotalea sp. TaxID=2029877 RepID=UPI003D6C1F6B
MRILFLLLLTVFGTSEASAFCGFYVAKADGALYNQSSKVVFVRDGNKSVITMSSDYRGAPADFAMIVPTPKVLRRDQIQTVDAKIVAHLDSYTAPRLVEYFDDDPCAPELAMASPVIVEESSARRNVKKQSLQIRARAKGVTIKAQYAVGQYDILILKAKESDGLATFLTAEGYKLPQGADLVLADYIGAGMKFLVAKVNLSRHAAKQSQDLPPLQISFRSKSFMLPIQLGKLNAEKAQDALFFLLSRKGRVEVANYKAKDLPSDGDVPVFVEKVFGQFYKAMFAKTVGRSGGIVMEYAWDMAWCDPCAADPLPNADLRKLGVRWARGNGTPQNVYVTRYHAQYSKGQMPKDLVFRETNNRRNFQGRYVMNHPYDGKVTCDEGRDYVRDTKKRLAQEANYLSSITGWSVSSIRKNIRKTVPAAYR